MPVADKSRIGAMLVAGGTVDVECGGSNEYVVLGIAKPAKRSLMVLDMDWRCDMMAYLGQITSIRDYGALRHIIHCLFARGRWKQFEAVISMICDRIPALEHVKALNLAEAVHIGGIKHHESTILPRMIPIR